MNWKKNDILNILDQCAQDFTFPVLDNGYVYLAATKLSIYQSSSDWALVIEIFGFSPREGEPNTQIYTFSSKLHNRNTLSNYVSKNAYENYLKNNPFNESRFIFPIENNDWQHKDAPERLKEDCICILRGLDVSIPERSEYARYGIQLEGANPLTYEFCRYLSGKYRELVLCTEKERRVSVLPEMELKFQLDEWCHPDISSGKLPSSSQTFQQLGKMIETGRFELFEECEGNNTHWASWPEAGVL